jgi:hypothetical protein
MLQEMNYLRFYFLTLLSGVTTLFSNENVLFRKVKPLSISQSTWLITLIIDLKPYDVMLDKSLQQLQELSEVAWSRCNTFEGFVDEKYTHHLDTISEELIYLNKSRSQLLSVFQGYRTLHNRRKRSILPFAGDILSFLFGTASESDMSNINKHINLLGENQEKLRHVMEHSLTFINMTGQRTFENRVRINKLSDGLGELTQAFRMLSNEIDDTKNVEQFLNFYMQLRDVVESAKEILFEIAIYMEHLHLQMNMLSLGKLTPSTLAPIVGKYAYLCSVVHGYSN